MKRAVTVAFLGILLLAGTIVFYRLFHWLNTDRAILKMVIQPALSPKTLVNVKSINGSYVITLMSPESDLNIMNLRQEVNVEIINGKAGQISGADDLTGKHISYGFEGSGDYTLQVEFYHVDKWPKEVVFTVEPGGT